MGDISFLNLQMLASDFMAFKRVMTHINSVHSSKHGHPPVSTNNLYSGPDKKG